MLLENKKVEYPMILCPESMQESDRVKKNDLASHNWLSENKSPKNKKENKVQCLPGILFGRSRLYTIMNIWIRLN